MGNYTKNFTKSLIVMLWIGLLVTTVMQSQNKATNIYVWDFKVGDESIEKYAEKFTDDFETELIKWDDYTVLQRRNHSLVLVHRDMENRIPDIGNLSTDAISELKTIKAEIVVFGELTEDVESGVYEVTVFFQNLDTGDIPKKESILIEKALIKSNSHRKQYMKSLITKLHAKEILAAKNEQLGFMSNKMDTYLVKVKDAQTAFGDIISIALEKEEYFKELENTINAYNKIFVDLNDNREQYILEFESVFGKTYGSDLEMVYNGIMNDIHKKHILKLNNVRKKIWAYRDRQKNKNERERLRKEIIRDSENSTLGLHVAIDKVEDDMDQLFSMIKDEMRK